MAFTSALGLILISLFGLAIIAGALNAKRLIAWENHALRSLADTLRDYRLSLEEEQRLLEPGHACAAEPPVQAQVRSHAHRSHQGNRAA